DSSLEGIQYHASMMFGKILIQFKNFFEERHISTSKFIFEDFRNILKTKIGPIAFQAILLLSENLAAIGNTQASNYKLANDKKFLLLLAAIFAQKIDRVRALLEEGVSPIQEDDIQKYVPLFYAIISAFINPELAYQMIALFVQKYKVDPKVPNFFGLLPILLVHKSMGLKSAQLLEVQIPAVALVKAIHGSKYEG